MNLQIDEIPEVSTYVKETADIIKIQVNEIISYCIKKENIIKRNNDINNYKQECMIKFTNFHQRYPTLFFSIIENPSSFPIYRLDEMLNLKEKIDNNKLNEQRASIHLGQKYYNEFVKDTVSNLDKEININKK